MFRPIALAALLAASPAGACDIHWQTYATDALIAADIGPTMDCLHREACHEANPFYGSRHPADGRLIGMGLGRIALNTGVACWLDDHAPNYVKLFNMVSLGINGGVVAANLRFQF